MFQWRNMKVWLWRLHDLRIKWRTVGTALLVVFLVVADGGALVGAWAWISPHLHNAILTTVAVAALVRLMPAQLSAIARTYALGYRHGRRDQRHRCARCDHKCGTHDDTGEMSAIVEPVGAAAGGATVVPMRRPVRANSHNLNIG